MKLIGIAFLWLLLWVVPCTATDVYGPTLANELIAAGLGGVQFSWRTDGTVTYGPSLTSTQITAIRQVLAAHDPTKQLPPQPDFVGFTEWMSTAFDFATLNTLSKAYPTLNWYGRLGNVAGIQWCVTDAQAKAVITATQYALFQGANQTYHIGMTLP